KPNLSAPSQLPSVTLNLNPQIGFVPLLLHQSLLICSRMSLSFLLTFTMTRESCRNRVLDNSVCFVHLPLGPLAYAVTLPSTRVQFLSSIEELISWVYDNNPSYLCVF
ncbi:hypothetical protein KSS87_004096, partial [Heliosperma pusillum]